MHRPNPVQSVAQQRQSFSTKGRVIGTQEPEPWADMAQEIYVRLVAGHYLDQNYNAQLELPHLQKLAEAAQSAAQAYFTQGQTHGES